jgi:hypothetical protein
MAWLQAKSQAKPEVYKPSQAKPNVMAWSWLWLGFRFQKPKPSQQAMALNREFKISFAILSFTGFSHY